MGFSGLPKEPIKKQDEQTVQWAYLQSPTVIFFILSLNSYGVLQLSGICKYLAKNSGIFKRSHDSHLKAIHQNKRSQIAKRLKFFAFTKGLSVLHLFRYNINSTKCSTTPAGYCKHHAFAFKKNIAKWTGKIKRNKHWGIYTISRSNLTYIQTNRKAHSIPC